MEFENKTSATYFILLGFSNYQPTNIVIFFIFSIIYLITCIGNVLIIFIIIVSPSLHTPMYFFLCNLSLTDLCYSSLGVPKFLSDIFSIDRTISLTACSFQLYSSLSVGIAECLLLAVMAYDRYVAICRPLYYNIIMNWNICFLWTAIIWALGIALSIVPSAVIHIRFCNPNRINHFMCEALAVIKLACDHVYLSEQLIFSFSFIIILLPFILIVSSYICIISSIINIDSVRRLKVFSTCSSHLTVVCLYYSTIMIMYSMSSIAFLSNQQKYVSVIYVLITPMLNPMVYCLKNRDVKETFRKFLTKLFVTYIEINKDV